MDERDKNCANCKYFKRYYMLNVCLRFVPVDEGLCCHINIYGRVSRKNVLKGDACELWQTNELEKLKKQYAAENVLQDINKKLEAIRVLLSEDQ